MFSESVYGTSFTEDVADSMFPIHGERLVEDYALMTILRAVLTPKMSGDHLDVRYDKTSFRPGAKNIDEGAAEAHRIVDTVTASEPNRLTIFSHDRGANKEYAENIADGFLQEFEGWKRVKKVTAFYKANFNVLCFINSTLKSVILIIECNSVPRMHLIACSLFALFPWYFNGESVDEEDIKLLQSLRGGSISDFYDALEPFKEKYDFYTPRLSVLDSVETEWIKAEIRSRRETINGFEDKIKAALDRISTCLKEKEDHQIRMHGLEYELEHREGSELTEYFKNNKERVRFSTSDDGNLTFYVTSEMMYWDDDFAQTLIDNERSYIHQSSRISADDFVKLFKSIFVDKELKLKFCAAYRIDTRNYRVNAVSGFEFEHAVEKNYLPNPHIQQYSCLGTYAEALEQMMAIHNYIGVIEQCVVSAQSFNLTDTTVLERFVEYVNHNKNRYIILPDGTSASPQEAIKFLNGDVGEEDNDEQKN